MLEVKNLTVKIGEKIILKNVSLNVDKNQIVAVMGPNGSGKTTLANVIIGNPDYTVVSGRILLDGVDITELPPEKRAVLGLFLAYQSPPEIPGVKLSTLLLATYNKKRGDKDNLLKTRDPLFYKRVLSKARDIGFSPDLLYRDLNVGLSGGEKKRSELLQLLILDPEYVILDEPDSGLDIDGLKMVGKILRFLRDSGKGVLLITHYTRLFQYVSPDRIIVMYSGRIVREDGPELAKTVEEKGYKKFVDEAGMMNHV
jgi:Fe-S cluster assembly ATP-binding protein